MTPPEDNAEAAVVAAILSRVQDDVAAGRTPSLAAYQAAFPGHEDLVARELADLARDIRDDERVDVEAVAPGEHGADRYEDRGEIARGGMGEIRRVWDRDLRRHLVLKRLREKRDPSDTTTTTQVLSRFLEEAQVTAQLDHPGIVPVHELGIDAQGRVFFTMSLIRGRNLREIYGLVDDGREGWTTTRALDVLLRVCEAVAFAHNKGVVHRDLKPANIMVGRFGETYVMDWGLARVLDQEDRKDIRIAPDQPMLSSVVTARRDLESTDPDSPLITMDGDIVGTPAYMAPEQARGEVDRVGPQSDVYAIGAMLYHLLAGRAPYVPEGSRTTSRTLLARVVDGPPTPLHRLAPSSPAELVAICERAMAREQRDRYPDVHALAEEVRAFLEMRVVRAYETGAVAELRKWVRRNKSVAFASAAALLALALGPVFSIAQMRRADASAQHADRQAKLAEGNAARAAGSARLAQRAVDEMLTQVAQESLLLTPHLTPLRRRLLGRARDFQLEFLRERGDDPTVREAVARAHFLVATAHHQLGESEQALVAFETALDRVDELIDGPERRDDLRPLRADVLTRMAQAQLRLGDHVTAELALERAAAELEDVLLRHPGDRTARKLEAYARDELATSLSNSGRHDPAVEARAEAIELWRGLADDDPDDLDVARALAASLTNDGITQFNRGQPQAAERAVHEALDTLKGIAAEHHSPDHRHRLAAAHHLLANVQMKVASLADAEASARAAVEIREQLVEDFPSVPVYRRELAGNLHGLGAVLRQTDVQAALDVYENAQRQQLRALEAMPKDRTASAFYRNHVHAICGSLLELGRYQECADWATKTEPIALSSLDAAKHLARCADLAAGDGELAPGDGAALRDRYTAQAIALLQQAVAAGFLDASGLQDAAFAPLRGDPAFGQLSAELAKKRQ